MKTYEAIAAEYAAFGATADDLADAGDNALTTLQDEYGFDNVTAASIEEGGEHRVEFLEWFASSLEGARADNTLNRRNR